MLLAKNCTSDRLTYLKHVHEAREKEVNTCENPQSHQFKMAVAERGTHTLNANVSVGAISRGKDASDSLPEGRDGGSRPADTAKEEQGDRHEDEQEDAVLATIDETGPEHGHKGTGGQIRHKEAHDLPEVSELRQPEPACNANGHIYAHEHKDEEVDEAFTEYNGKGVLIVLCRRDDEAAETFTRTSHGHSDAEAESLLENEHEHWRDEEGRETTS